MESKNKNVLLVITIVILIVIVFGATYAYFVAQTGAGQSANINVTANTTDSLMFEVGKDLSLNITQANFGQGAGNQSDSTTAKAILMANNKTNTARYTYNLYLHISKNEFVYTTEENTPEILLQITKPDGTALTTLTGLNYVTVGSTSGFDITTKKGLVKISLDKVIEVLDDNTNHKTEEEWTIGITFVNLDSNQQANTNKRFVSKIIIQQEELDERYHKLCNDNTLACQVAKKYETDSTLYLHDSTLANGAEDNSYRYAGASNSVNNYVCFGIEGTTCDEDHLYRMIGLFDDDTDGEYNVKLIKNKSLGSIAFDSNNSNVWETATINQNTLNGTYLTGLGSYASMIRDTAWNVGGHNTSIATAKAFLDREKSSQASRSKIGLMYVSDYGYAAYPNAWTTNLGDYDNANIKANNWMFMGGYEWTITPNSSNSNYVFLVHNNGYASNRGANYGCAVPPVLYLNSNIVLKGGDGTSSSPYIIGE